MDATNATLAGDMENGLDFFDKSLRKMVVDLVDGLVEDGVIISYELFQVNLEELLRLNPDLENDKTKLVTKLSSMIFQKATPQPIINETRLKIIDKVNTFVSSILGEGDLVE